MPGQTAPVPCPKCSGPMWSNIEGKRNPKAPDYACKDKQGCGAGVWLTDVQKSAVQAQTPASTAASAPPRKSPLVLDKIMLAALKSASAMADEAFGALASTIDATVDASLETAHYDRVLRIAQSLYIARIDGKGIFEVERNAVAEMAAKVAAIKAEKERKEAEERAKAAPPPPEPEGYDDDFQGGFDGDGFPYT